LRLEILETKMIPKAGTYLQRSRVRQRGAERIPMGETQNARMVCRQPLVEVTNPVILDAKLFLGQARGALRPPSPSGFACRRTAITVSCRTNEAFFVAFS